MNRFTFTAGLLLSAVSFSLQAHGGHSHAHQQTEAERQASQGIFADKDVKARPLSDWDGMWQSVNGFMINGDLDPVLKAKAEKGGKSLEEYREYYKKGYATTVDTIGIENGVIEFHQGDRESRCQYTSSGFKILQYASGKKGVRYLFECKDSSSKAPKFIQFSDHIISPTKSSHFHIFMGNESHEKLLQEMDNWPTYYPWTMSKEEVVAEMLHH